MFGKGKREYNSHHIPLINKIGYGFGAMADNLIMNAFGGLVMPVYNIALFVDPALLGWAIAIPRIFDAISDPLMGNISDNTRSRLGRRRSWMLASSVPVLVFSIMLWGPPRALEGTALLVWVGVAVLGFYTAYTVFGVPHMALGAELTHDTQERNRNHAVAGKLLHRRHRIAPVQVGVLGQCAGGKECVGGPRVTRSPRR